MLPVILLPFSFMPTEITVTFFLISCYFSWLDDVLCAPTKFTKVGNISYDVVWEALLWEELYFFLYCFSQKDKIHRPWNESVNISDKCKGCSMVSTSMSIPNMDRNGALNDMTVRSLAIGEQICSNSKRKINWIQHKIQICLSPDISHISCFLCTGSQQAEGKPKT